VRRIPRHYAWTVLAVCVWVVFVSIGLGRFGYGLLLPSMQDALGLDNTGAGTLATVSLTGYLVFALVCGALTSRFGARIVIFLGLLLAGAGMLLTGTVRNTTAALLSLLLVGCGSGATNVPAMAMLSFWFGRKLRGLAAGIVVTGSSVAFILLGPLVPRFLVAIPDMGWRYTWYLYGAFSLLCSAGSLLLLRNDPSEMDLSPLGEPPGESHGEPPGDLPEKPLDTAIKPEEPGHAGPWESWGRVLRSSRVWYLGMLYTAFGYSYIIYATYFIKHLVDGIGMSPVSAGSTYMLVGWFSLACGLLWSGLSDRIGRGWALCMVYLLQVAAYSLFAFGAGRGALTLSACLFGLTAWSAPAIVSATCGDLVGPRLAPAALGFVTIFFGIGQILGPMAGGVIADATGTFRGAFLSAGAVTILGALGAPFLKSAKGAAGG
jgi:MFS family permease